MFRLRRRPFIPSTMTEEYAQFVRVVDRVEESKAALVDAAPTGRPARVPLAEALAGFEEGLAAAELAMPAWRSNRTERVWADCRSGLEEARLRAERLRLEANPEGYEELVAVIDLLLEPLEAFRRASVWFAEAPGGRWIP